MLQGSPRTAVFAWLQTGLLVANLVWTTACLGGYRAGTMVVTVALTGALLVVHALQLLVVRWCAWGSRAKDGPAGAGAPPSADGAERLRVLAGALFLPFLLYAAANVEWVSPVKWLGWLDWFGWFQLLAVTWVAFHLVQFPGSRRVLWGALLLVGLGSVALAAYQRFANPEWLMLGRLQVEQYVGRSSGPFGIPNSLAALLLLLLPASAALALRPRAEPSARVFFGWATLVLLFGLGLTISRGAWLGLGLALVVWPLLRTRRPLHWRLLRAAGTALLVIAAASLTYLGSERVRERVDALVADAGERSRPILWRAGWKLVQEQPWFGTGAGSFNTVFERYRPEGFLNEPMWAHNDYLNTASDYGMVGVALLIGPLLWLSLRRSRNAAGGLIESVREEGGASARRLLSARPPLDGLDDRLVREGLRIGVLAFALQLFVDFHFKIPALALAFGVTTALAWRAPSNRQRVDPDSPRPMLSIVAAVNLFVGVVAIAVFFRPLYQAEALRERGRERIDALIGAGTEHPGFKENVNAALHDLQRAAALMPLNSRAAADLSYAYAQLSLVEPARTSELGRRAEAAAQPAVLRSPAVAEFWIRRGVARDMQGLYAEAGDDFTRALALAPKTPLPWFHYAYHLSLRPVGLPLAEAMVATCLRLDPKNPEGLRLRQHLATARSSR